MIIEAQYILPRKDVLCTMSIINVMTWKIQYNMLNFTFKIININMCWVMYNYMLLIYKWELETTLKSSRKHKQKKNNDGFDE